MDSTARHYVDAMHADLRLKVRRMGTVVACPDVAGDGRIDEP